MALSRATRHSESIDDVGLSHLHGCQTCMGTQNKNNYYKKIALDKNTFQPQATFKLIDE